MFRLTPVRTVLLALAATFTAQAGAPLINPVTGKAVRWPTTSIKFKMSRTVHMPAGSETGVDPRDTAAAVHAAVADAARAWTEANKLDISIEMTDQTVMEPGDSLITFTDPGPYETAGCNKAKFVGCALAWFAQDGTLVGFGIAFNPFKKLSASGLKGTADIGIVALHEFGHALGLDHSVALDAVMQANAEIEPDDPNTFLLPLRLLSRDDIYTMAGNYPEGINPTGRIEGTVRAGGQAAGGVTVLALDASGRVAQSWLTRDGTYSLVVPPGDYFVVACGPIAPWYWNAKGGGAEREAVKVDGGQTVAAIDLSVNPVAALGVRATGVLLGRTYFAADYTMVARGEKVTLGFYRTTGSTTNAAVEIPDALGKNDGPAAPVNGFTSEILFQPVTVSPTAEPGAYTVVVKTGNTSAILAGAVRVVLFPKIESVVDAETGAADALFKAGRKIKITGTDLSFQEGKGVQWTSGAPFPTQVVGVSVRVSGILAPIESVSPTEIIAIVPEGLTGESADVTVATGGPIESTVVKIKLQP